MPYSTRYPAENASFSSQSFWENVTTARPREAETVIVGQTVIGRYAAPEEITIRGFCGSTERGNLRSAVNTSATLVWSGGSQSAFLRRFESTWHPEFDLFEIALGLLL